MMKNIKHNAMLIAILLISIIQGKAQEFKTGVSEFQVDEKATIVIEASYAEIEIEEWNKNRVEVQGVMNVEGMTEDEAKNVFEGWEIETEKRGNEVRILANSDTFGNEYFFIHNDKYLGNVVVDIPEISAHVLEALDSIHVVLPEIAQFPDFDFDFDISTNLDYESLNFDYEEFKNNSAYLKEWQERNKEQLQRLREDLKQSHQEMAEEQKQMQRRIIVLQEKAEIEAERQWKQHSKEVEKYAREAEKEAREMEKVLSARQGEIQKILEKRQKIKVKRTLKIKLPKSAKLEMDVDYCKITTVN